MAENEEQRERRWREILQHAEIVRQVHPARRLPSEGDMLWLLEEVKRLRAEQEEHLSPSDEADQPTDTLPRAA